MSDEESAEGFSASEDEWKPNAKEKRGGESSDDDDSDFGGDEVLPLAATAVGATNRKRLEPKGRNNAAKQTVAKKRKSIGQSLRAKLYNKYRPPPKTVGGGGSNSPTASTSRSASTKTTASKNARAPNESSEPHDDDDDDDDNSSSDSSVDDYLVQPAELDLQSSFFDVSKGSAAASATDAPTFDCSGGLKDLSDSGSENNNESDGEVVDAEKHAKSTKAFDFRHLLEKANSLERAKETIAKRAAEASSSGVANADVVPLDVNSLLALGEKKQHDAAADAAPLKLSKTKSTRVKRHTKTRPNSTVLSATAAAAAAAAAGGGGGAPDTDDSDFEEVADDNDDEVGSTDTDRDRTHSDSLEIHVALPTRQRSSRAEKKQQDIEMAIKRRLNRDLKDRQLLLHKTSLLCCFARSYVYNKLINDPTLMQAALMLLPGKSAYPPDRTLIKYYVSLATWFKTTIRLASPNLYPEKKTAALKRERVRNELMKQIMRKEARCKQDMVIMFAILVRGMGMQCRLVVNMQPLPIRPSQADLLPISLKRQDLGNGGGPEAKIKKIVADDTATIKKPAEDRNTTSVILKNLTKEKDSAPTLQENKKHVNKNDNLMEKNNVPKEKTKDSEMQDNMPKKRQIMSKEKSKDSKEQNKDPKETHNALKDKTKDSREQDEGSKEKSSASMYQTFKDSNKESLEKIDQMKKTTSMAESFPPVAHAEKSPAGEKINFVAPIADINEMRQPTNKHAEFAVTKENESTDKTQDTQENNKEIHEKIPQIATSKIRKLASLDVQFTPVARRTRHASVEKFESTYKTQNTQEKNTEFQEKIPQIATSKIKKLASLDVQFTPVARRTRHASIEKVASKGHENLKEIVNAATKKTTNKLTSIKETTQESSDKPLEEKDKKLLQKNKENVVLHSKDAQEQSIENINKTTQKIKGRPVIEVGSPVIPNIVVHQVSEISQTSDTDNAQNQRDLRSRSKSPKLHISPTFLQTKTYSKKFRNDAPKQTKAKTTLGALTKNTNNNKVKISTQFLKQPQINTRITRSRKLLDDTPSTSKEALSQLDKFTKVPQFDGADDSTTSGAGSKKKRPQLKKLQNVSSSHNANESITISSDDDFMPSPPKRPKQAPKFPKSVQALRKDRRVLSTDDEAVGNKKRETATDIWIEVWSDVEEQWFCLNLFNLFKSETSDSVEFVNSIRKSASSSFDYVFAFQNDLSVKDVTARYCKDWTTIMRKSRVPQSWLQGAINAYQGHRTSRDIREDYELRHIHESKPMPTTITSYKDHPLYALEMHLLKFQAIYPPDAPTLGFVRGKPVYSRDCVHLLHSREIWLKQARTVKLGEQPYKVVKARPKWDRLTQTVIKDQPLEIFGYWQTQDYEPPTAENGMVPRNAYGNVELFKACMLPKKTAHVKLPGLQRICKKLGIDCANAVVGFDFHQGSCHPTYDGSVICEEFVDQVTAAWYQDQEEQERKDVEKHEARVYGNWKKLIRGLLIRERLKKKYNF